MAEKRLIIWKGQGEIMNMFNDKHMDYERTHSNRGKGRSSLHSNEKESVNKKPLPFWDWNDDGKWDELDLEIERNMDPVELNLKKRAIREELKELDEKYNSELSNSYTEPEKPNNRRSNDEFSVIAIIIVAIVIIMLL